VAITDIDRNKTVNTSYYAGGRVNQITAQIATGTATVNQITKHLYDDAVNKSRPTSIIYPDSTDTTATGTNQIKVSYDRLGRTVTKKDQRGVLHTYVFDSAGRRIADQVTGLPTTVDSSVQRLAWTYDDQSRVATLSS
jgi:YD repeat-containing protein